MRLMPSQVPRAGPWIWMASIMKCEQVGSKRQPAPGPEKALRTGLIQRWYTRTPPIKQELMWRRFMELGAQGV